MSDRNFATSCTSCRISCCREQHLRKQRDRVPKDTQRTCSAPSIPLWVVVCAGNGPNVPEEPFAHTCVDVAHVHSLPGTTHPHPPHPHRPPLWQINSVFNLFTRRRPWCGCPCWSSLVSSVSGGWYSHPQPLCLTVCKPACLPASMIRTTIVCESCLSMELPGFVG